jgi:hypothetical protein
MGGYCGAAAGRGGANREAAEGGQPDAKVAKDIHRGCSFCWKSFCDFCETFATFASGSPFPRLSPLLDLVDQQTAEAVHAGAGAGAGADIQYAKVAKGKQPKFAKDIQRGGSF